MGAARSLDPACKARRRKRTVIVREVVNGLMYVSRRAVSVRTIPKDLPERPVHGYFDLRTYDGTLDRIHHGCM